MAKKSTSPAQSASMVNKSKSRKSTVFELLTTERGWDKSPSLSIVFGLSSKMQWLSGLYYADFISFYSPTQLCGDGTTKSNSNELPISVPLSFPLLNFIKSTG
ncbi:hypothetical protein LH656_06610 [Streptococcus sinensis]|nr:hypothetical protein [Streptococcus sinensis]MCF1284593.1 hypothetical protein [Streptococcus sinensis]